MLSLFHASLSGDSPERDFWATTCGHLYGPQFVLPSAGLVSEALLELHQESWLE